MAAVMVVGAGKVGAHLASVLVDGGHRVTVIEVDSGRTSELESQLAAVSIVVGSGAEATTLERAGIRGCDVLAAVTGADETNLVICGLARYEFDVPRTLARIVDPANAWMYAKDMGVDIALNQADLLAHLAAEEMSLGEMTILLKLRRGSHVLVEEVVDPGSPVVGRRYGDIEWPTDCRVVAVIRNGDLAVMNPDTVLNDRDEILAVAHNDAVGALAQLLGSPGNQSR